MVSGANLLESACSISVTRKTLAPAPVTDRLAGIHDIRILRQPAAIFPHILGAAIGKLGHCRHDHGDHAVDDDDNGALFRRG